MSTHRNKQVLKCQNQHPRGTKRKFSQATEEELVQKRMDDKPAAKIHGSSDSKQEDSFPEEEEQNEEEEIIETSSDVDEVEETEEDYYINVTNKKARNKTIRKIFLNVENIDVIITESKHKNTYGLSLPAYHIYRNDIENRPGGLIAIIIKNYQHQHLGAKPDSTSVIITTKYGEVGISTLITPPPAPGITTCKKHYNILFYKHHISIPHEKIRTQTKMADCWKSYLKHFTS
ncbi:hypothetical protein PR048_005165 [Dryococelus australis]|uniref:Uncharacterized protein n=1 Tax=Dryococelus australis TaxID=614101 RepID=A0ABQ9I8H8_9NEOP|nr:hypothetical protein PR048_005165 [Dryococelus australis]